MERTHDARPLSSSQRRANFWLLLALATLCFMLLVSFRPAAAAEDPGSGSVHQPEATPLIRCDPVSVTALVGQNAVIDLYMQDITNLYGMDLRVSYDPTIGQVIDQNLYAPGTQFQLIYTFFVHGFVIKQDVYGPSDIPPNCGTHCLWYAGTQLNPTPPVYGSGPIARVTFLGLQAGTFPMNWINTQLSAPGGIPITPVNNLPCSVTFESPTAVTLAGFEAQQTGDAVQVTWETVSELDNAGFNLYRSQDAAAPGQQLNSALIPSAAPGSGQGASYQWQDLDVQLGNTYFYRLETVALNGATEMHGPVSVTFAGPTAVMLDRVSASPSLDTLGHSTSAGVAALPWLWTAVAAGAALGVGRRRRR